MGAPRLKTRFAPLPLRALRDQRFTAIHFRVLGAIASHDMMSVLNNKGEGCWAGHEKLAEEAGCDYTNLSTAISALVDWGYIRRKKHPLNGRLRVYTVVYDSLPNDKPSPTNSSPIDKQSADPSFAQTEPIVCQPERQEPDGAEISRTEDILRSKVNIEEAIHNGIRKKPDVANIELQLDQIEREIGAPDLTPEHIQHLRTELYSIAKEVPTRHPLYPFLERLDDRLERAAKASSARTESKT